MTLVKFIWRASATGMLMLFLFSCASYNQQSSGFYSSLVKGNYEKASKELDHNKLLGKNRNRLLYLLEKGKMEHLLQHYEASNNYLNEADLLMEDSHSSAKDIAAGTLLNPMMETYRGEDFEKYMVHYYKALNYLQLNETQEALVEARRIMLRTNTQEEKSNKGNRYTDDAFSLMLQGMIYEKGGDINNAFIAYRNSADVYLENKEEFYGTKMPAQLKKDVVRTAFLNGFTDEADRYSNLFNIKLDSNEIYSEGALILFWENGLAPVKKEQNLFFSLAKDGSGNFFFVDNAGSYNIPFDFSSGYNKEKLNAGNLHMLRAAVPRYEQQPVLYKKAIISIDSLPACLEPAQNINELAFATLNERKIKELSKTLTRIAIKKLAEEVAKPKEDEKDKKKKDRQEALSMGLQLFSLASEKADTRNWQSLPHSIYFARIPLKKGQNQLSVELIDEHGQPKTVQLIIESSGGLVFRNICTL
jgi:hypothetical protein